MKPLIIIKTGTTFTDTIDQHGDFDLWTKRAIGATSLPLKVVDVEQGELLPQADQCAGAIITGSHSMVTDDLPWSVKTEQWLVDAIAADVPIFGTCYGHQLLGRAAGGEVGYHPQGKEVGTVSVQLSTDSHSDPIFADLPSSFKVHATHAQSVLKLPPQAHLLAGNSYEQHHAFRVGPSAWGVQFHPEYDATIMRIYAEHQVDILTEQGRDLATILDGIEATPVASHLLHNFIRFVEQRQSTAH